MRNIKMRREHFKYNPFLIALERIREIIHIRTALSKLHYTRMALL
ncbi:hypothetical protein [Candidatus Nitrotoga sp. M5]|nr:hypothetical protein [Candidatus Nitrotoga sp. M5]